MTRMTWAALGLATVMTVPTLWATPGAATARGAQVAASDSAQRESARLGPNIRISGSRATGNDFGAQVAYNPTEEQYLVVWDDRRRNGTYGQLLDRAGNRVGWNFRVMDQGGPKVAYNSTDNEYLVIGEDLGVYGQRIGADGDRLGQTFEISAPDLGGWTAIAHNPADNRYLVVKTYRGIIGQLVDSDGSLVGPSFAIDGRLATGWHGWPDVAANPGNGEFLVVWEDGRKSATRELDIFAQRVSPDGRRIGPNFGISARTADQRTPAVAYSEAAKRFLVVWSDERRPRRGADIFGQLLTDDGARSGQRTRLSGGAAVADELWPAVAHAEGAGRFLVTWMDYRNEATREQDIYGQHLTPDGDRMGRNTRLSGPRATGAEWEPDSACDPVARRCLVVWDDYRNRATRGVDTYGQLVAP